MLESALKSIPTQIATAPLAVLTALSITVTWPASAQMPATDFGKEWQSLNTQMMAAHRAGDFANAAALRTAGARNVLVTLWPLNDGEARDFMVEFCRTWLGQPVSDPAKALRDTQFAYVRNDDPQLRNPRVWAP